MIIREKYLSKIRPFYDQDLIKVIMGVRRCGKSVILLQIIDELKEKIESIYNLGNISSKDMTYLSDARSISLLEKVMDSVKDINSAIINSMPIDMIEIDIKNVWNLLGEITGENYNDELIDNLFSKFCVGK